MRFLRPALVCLAAVLLAGLTTGSARGQTTGPQDYSDTLSNRQIVINLSRIAFGSEYVDRRKERLQKWVVPLRIGIVTQTYPDYFEDWVSEHARELAKLTGHPIELYFSPRLKKAGQLPEGFADRNINVYLYYAPTNELSKHLTPFFSESELEFMLQNATYFANLRKKGDEIKIAAIAFPAELPKEIMRICIVEEITQILGLANDSDAVNPSVFNDTNEFNELTGHDKLLLRILYSEKLEVGMARKEALRRAYRLLKEWRGVK